MELSFEDLNFILKNTRVKYSIEQIKVYLKDAKTKYFEFLDPILKNENKGYEKSLIEDCSPLLWEAGHPIFFIEKHCVRYLFPEDPYPKQPDKFYNNLYDSHIIPNELKYTIKLPTYKDINQYYLQLHFKMMKFLKKYS